MKQKKQKKQKKHKMRASTVLFCGLVFLVQAIVGAGPHQGVYDPLKLYQIHAAGIHFMSGNLTNQCIVHHFCGEVQQGVQQCLLYDSDKPNSKLMGLEYVVADNIFNTFPEEERKLWHSHQFEVKAGMVVVLNASQDDEKKYLEFLVNSYGKTFHSWLANEGQTYPFGVPHLMMAFTQQIQDSMEPQLIKDLDTLAKSTMESRRSQRNSLAAKPIVQGADQWQSGKAALVCPCERSFAFPHSNQSAQQEKQTSQIQAQEKQPQAQEKQPQVIPASTTSETTAPATKP